MREWIRRWLSIGQPSRKDFEDLAASAVEALAKAQQEHISDLRVLIDKGNQREAEMAAMVKLAMEHQFYRPAISGAKAPENRIGLGMPGDALNDVAVFDEVADAELVKQQESQLAALITEQNRDGTNKVE